MSKFKNSKVGKVISTVVGFTTAVLMFGGSFALPASAQTVEQLQQQIQSLLATIQQLQQQIAALQGGSTSGGSMAGTGYTFTRNLKMGDRGEDVRQLQIALNKDPDTQVAASGPGSPGNETSYFGSLTKQAVIKFQEKYASEILAPLGLTAGTGYFGPSTRAKMNELMAQTAPPPSVPPPVTTPTSPTYDGDVTVSAASTQPPNGLAPANAARVPFTRVTFTAGPNGATVDSITVERGGVSLNSDVSGVVLLDENGVQLGVAKSLNSDNRATLTEDFTIPPNSSRTMTIGANMPASPGAGNVITLSVVDVKAKGGNVSGSFPITGAYHTVNIATTIGTASLTALSQSSATKEIGTTGYIFAAIRVTAGSTEKIRLNAVRWNQTGSASKDDLKNVVVDVDGTTYNTEVSEDGKYYTAVFPGGIVIDKGNSVEMRLKGDIVGGSTRTVIFDIHRATDINITGEQFGFGITPTAASTGTASDSSAQFTTGTPFYDGAKVTIGGGSIQVSKATSIGAQNIAENAPDQVLGGFDVEVKGENISVGQIDFYFDVSGASGNASDITNVVLVRNDTGSVVAGPVDGAVTGGNQRVRFTDTVIFPVGEYTYVLKGKVGTDFADGDQITASTTPSTDWTTVTGEVTGDTITPSPSSAVTANPVTVKAGALTISVSSLPLAQTIVAGSPFVFANYEIDTTQSGEDIRLSSLVLEYGGTGDPENLRSCQLKNGATVLTSGSNTVNPTAFSSSTTFTFDTPQVFEKGKVTTLALECDTNATTTGTSYRWGIDSGTSNGASIVPTAVGSGESINETINDNPGQLITLTTGGSYTVVNDNTPGYRIASPGTEVTLLKLKFSATNEDIDIRRVAFQLGETASNTPLDLVGKTVTLWDGTTQIGTAVFSESGVTADYATSTLIAEGAFRVPKDGSKTMTVKGTIAGISATGPLLASGDLIKVNWDADDANSTTPPSGGNYGTGVSGGTDVVPSTTSDVALSSGVGVRIMKAYPTFERIPLSSSDTTLNNGSDKRLYRFKVTANNGDVALYKITFNVSSSSITATTSLFGLYAYTDSAFSSVDTTFSTDGLLNAGKCFNGSNNTGAGASGKPASGHPSVPTLEIYMDKTGCNQATTTYEIPSGDERFFELRGTISSVDTTSGSADSFEVSILGDAAFPVNSSTLLSKPGELDTEGVDADVNDDLIWSPRSTSTSASIDDLDWTNGYQVPGLPSSNTSAELFSR